MLISKDDLILKLTPEMRTKLLLLATIGLQTQHLPEIDHNENEIHASSKLGKCDKIGGNYQQFYAAMRN